MIVKGLRIMLVLFPVMWTGLLSQQLSHQVLVPVAGVASDSKISYSQTIGETAVQIVGCTQYLFTQGFQQPCMIRTDARPPDGTGVKVYPNPASDYLTIELFGEKEKSFRISIINILGREVWSDRKVFYDQYWYREPQNIQNLSSGFYLIRIKSDDGMIDRIFKIEKI